MTKRHIVAVAMRDGALILTQPIPARHHTLIHAAYDMGIRKKFTSDDQGFLDNYGQFVGRREAGEIAVSSGQIKALRWPPFLYSEDLF